MRERIRQLGTELFELCCRLPKQPDAQDFFDALALVLELKALRACEERLTQVEKVEHVESLRTAR